jgi:hypothetical protein
MSVHAPQRAAEGHGELDVGCAPMHSQHTRSAAARTLQTTFTMSFGSGALVAAAWLGLGWTCVECSTTGERRQAKPLPGTHTPPT